MYIRDQLEHTDISGSHLEHPTAREEEVCQYLRKYHTSTKIIVLYSVSSCAYIRTTLTQVYIALIRYV